VNKVKLAFKKLHPDAKIPSYAHEGDAGMDVRALEDTTLPLHIPKLVRTGIAAEIPDGYEIQVRSRSGLALKGVQVYNAPGTVDSKYRGEIGVILMYINREVETEDREDGGASPSGWIKTSYAVKAGDKIAQLVLAPVTTADISETEELSETDRGTNGFGSTGR
jgi:dUTP pyrophosphatase